MVLALAPATASAKIIEMGQTDEALTPSCPTPKCLAVSRTTGYQVKVGDTDDMFTVPHRGRIVAWTIALGDPTGKQIKFFNTTLGGEPSAGITVFKPAKHLYGTILSQSPVSTLTDYLGRSVQFPLERALSVSKGDRVALTVPTWAPALAYGLDSDVSWRASRSKDKCDDTSSQTAQSKIGSTTRFLCLYKTARLTYTVTLITEPRTNKQKAKKKKK
jgi:hypothetical protein